MLRLVKDVDDLLSTKRILEINSVHVTGRVIDSLMSTLGVIFVSEGVSNFGNRSDFISSVLSCAVSEYK